MIIKNPIEIAGEIHRKLNNYYVNVQFPLHERLQGYQDNLLSDQWFLNMRKYFMFTEKTLKDAKEEQKELDNLMKFLESQNDDES